jgi:DNA adenine methylase
MPATVNRVSPPLKWHGGKWYLAPKIVALMPPHTHYVEAYAGGLSVLLAKDPEGTSEVANDIDGELSTFWRVLRQEESFGRFRRTLEAVPFSEAEWRDAERAVSRDPLERAVPSSSAVGSRLPGGWIASPRSAAPAPAGA